MGGEKKRQRREANAEGGRAAKKSMSRRALGTEEEGRKRSEKTDDRE